MHRVRFDFHVLGSPLSDQIQYQEKYKDTDLVTTFCHLRDIYNNLYT